MRRLSSTKTSLDGTSRVSPTCLACSISVCLQPRYLWMGRRVTQDAMFMTRQLLTETSLVGTSPEESPHEALFVVTVGLSLPACLDGIFSINMNVCSRWRLPWYLISGWTSQKCHWHGRYVFLGRHFQQKYLWVGSRSVTTWVVCSLGRLPSNRDIWMGRLECHRFVIYVRR
jgi:hypothetical protein